jgi:hypothetical protein
MKLWRLLRDYVDHDFRSFAAWYWRRRIKRDEVNRGKWTEHFMAWKRENPDRCMYCMYTRWVREEHGLLMPVEPHHCIEGKSPPHPLPRVEVL